ncbi:hypothetical protein HID58_093966 [Brassica napus]|uniref:Uncharacterized protein n=1 Tax=Brassica napus TaxID=3708 RepID=A0ABQ7X981_BRANA|nr:hypothetical protein HID58_093966 [Brassica napus]
MDSVRGDVRRALEEYGCFEASFYNFPVKHRKDFSKEEVMGVDFADKNEDKVNEFTHKLGPKETKVSCTSEWSGSYG